MNRNHKRLFDTDITEGKTTIDVFDISTNWNIKQVCNTNDKEEDEAMKLCGGCLCLYVSVYVYIIEDNLDSRCQSSLDINNIYLHIFLFSSYRQRRSFFELARRPLHVRIQ